MSDLEIYFKKFREQIIGIDSTYSSPYGIQNIVYADWTASGRLYRPIEEALANDFGPYVANTHTETSTTGALMTLAYKEARKIIKSHVNASNQEILITTGTGMTGVINKFQRILGLKVSENLKNYTNIPDNLRPVVFITHMEHHSNQISWEETIADVVVVKENDKGGVCLESFEKEIKKYIGRPIKIASVVAASNVTGIRVPYHEIARLLHRYNGFCFVDFACSAPYVDIDMNPQNKEERLDAIFFSPHKFLGGPATSGVILFNSKLYTNKVPDNPGGGTVIYTNPWGGRDYFDDIEIREDSGTPGFLQTIKIALALRVKDQMGTKNIHDRELEINKRIFECLENLEGVRILASNIKDRLSIFSFYFEDYHYNLVVKLLNDRFGIQTRGGCSCAGTYGHFLLDVDKKTSHEIYNKIKQGYVIEKPGWIRLSLHPTTTNKEIIYICNALEKLHQNINNWSSDYIYNASTNDYIHKSKPSMEKVIVSKWFSSFK